MVNLCTRVEQALRAGHVTHSNADMKRSHVAFAGVVDVSTCLEQLGDAIDVALLAADTEQLVSTKVGMLCAKLGFERGTTS